MSKRQQREAQAAMASVDAPLTYYKIPHVVGP